MNKIFNNFNFTAKVLHWLSAVVILWATSTGLYIAFFDVNSDLKRELLNLNVSITFIFIPFFLWRIINKIKTPNYNDLINETEARIAKYIHNLLYFLVTFTLISGTLMMEQDIKIFNLFSFSPLINNDALITYFKIGHMFLSRILATFIILHILAVIKHELKGTRILKRMI